MAHFAEIKSSNNMVVRVLVFSNEDINKHGGDLSLEAEQWVSQTPSSIDEPVYWKQTSYNDNFRRLFAGKEYIYDKVNDIFIRRKPFNSWTLGENFEWYPPIQHKLPKPHPDWIINENSWDELNAQKRFMPPLAFPSVLNYDDNGNEKGYDIRWDRNRSMWIGIKHDGSFWDYNNLNKSWSLSSISQAPTLGTFLITNWNEENQKWTAVNLLNDSLNYQWNIQNQTWELI